MDLKNKVMIITGAGRGIGKAAAKECLEQGASVVLVESVLERMNQAVASLDGFHSRLLPIHESASSAAGAKRIVRQALDRFGKIDVLVNNASITSDGLLHKMTVEQWEQVIDNNLKGPFVMTRSVVPHMREQKSGRIVNMIAASAVAGNIGQTNYAAAKGGLLAMTLTWSRELSKKHIMVNAVIPAAWTEMSESIPREVLIKLVGEEKYNELRSRKPEQVAPLIAYLASDASEGVTGKCFGIAGRQFTVWDYARPQFEATAKGNRWTPQALDQLLKTHADSISFQPVSPFL